LLIATPPRCDRCRQALTVPLGVSAAQFAMYVLRDMCTACIANSNMQSARNIMQDAWHSLHTLDLCTTHLRHEFHAHCFHTLSIKNLCQDSITKRLRCCKHASPILTGWLGWSACPVLGRVRRRFTGSTRRRRLLTLALDQARALCTFSGPTHEAQEAPGRLRGHDWRPPQATLE
jgi:hypothetical protein